MLSPRRMMGRSPVLLVSPAALTEYEQAGDYDASHTGYEKLF
jgi:hypothetical protein